MISKERDEYITLPSIAELMYGDAHTAILETSIHMEQGCLKYGDRNWERGIPLHCYIDSGCRHFISGLAATRTNLTTGPRFGIFCVLYGLIDTILN